MASQNEKKPFSSINNIPEAGRMLPSQSPQNQRSSYTSSPLLTHHYIMLHNASQDTVSYKRIMEKYSLLLNQTQGNKPESNKAKKATLAAITSKEIFSIQ